MAGVFVGASILFLAGIAMPGVSEVVFRDLDRSFLVRIFVSDVNQVASRNLNRSVLLTVLGVQLVHALLLVAAVLYSWDRPHSSREGQSPNA
jgi:hypothetical protein